MLDHRPAKWFTLSYPCVPNSLHIMHISCLELCCMSCIACFLKTLYECMFIVNCLMFRLAERNEELLQLKLLPLLLSKASGIHEISYIFCLCMFSLLYLSYACVEKYCYAKTTISFILVVSSTHVNLVEIVAMQKVLYSKC